MKKGLIKLKNQLCKETTEVFFEATGFYFRQIETFFKDREYFVLHPKSIIS